MHRDQWNEHSWVNMSGNMLDGCPCCKSMTIFSSLLYLVMRLNSFKHSFVFFLAFAAHQDKGRLNLFHAFPTQNKQMDQQKLCPEGCWLCITQTYSDHCMSKPCFRWLDTSLWYRYSRCYLQVFLSPPASHLQSVQTLFPGFPNYFQSHLQVSYVMDDSSVCSGTTKL